jgi:enoyl-CoA hydratase/carnithine racemase
MERRFVKVEKGLGPQGRIAIVRFDRGDNINALSRQAMRELRDVPRDFEDDLETTVIILTGSAKAFSAGFDLKDPEGAGRRSLLLGETLLNQRLGPRLCKAWEQLEQVTIAAIEGHCIGGGAALAVSLDFRFCGKGAHFRIPEVELGMNMSWGSIPRLLALIGPPPSRPSSWHRIASAPPKRSTGGWSRRLSRTARSLRRRQNLPNASRASRRCRCAW